MGKSDEEKNLLAKLASGLLDGDVGGSVETTGGSTVWFEIIKGIPTQLKQGPGRKFFNGKENEHFDGALTVKGKWKTDDQKLAFLQKFGWLINDDDAKKYSAKFKPKK